MNSLWGITLQVHGRVAAVVASAVLVVVGQACRQTECCGPRQAFLSVFVGLRVDSAAFRGELAPSRVSTDEATANIYDNRDGPGRLDPGQPATQRMHIPVPLRDRSRTVDGHDADQRCSQALPRDHHGWVAD